MSRKFLTPIVLPADPSAALEAATKQYVDGLVVVSASDPIATNPNAELWVDSDQAGPNQPLPASMPRGYITHAKIGSGDQVFTALAWGDIAGMSVSWTAESTRRYLITMKAQITKLTAVGEMYVGVSTAAGAVLETVAVSGLAIGAATVVTLPIYVAGLSGAVSYKMRAQPATNGMRVAAASVEYGPLLLVEDIGGV